MSRKEIKATARHLLQSNFHSFVILFLGAYLIYSFVVTLPSTLLSVPDKLSLYISQIILSLLLEALAAMFMLGVARCALLLVRGRRFSFQDLLFVFRNQADHFLALELIFAGISCLTSLPGYIYSWINITGETSLLTYTVVTGLFSGLSSLLTFLLTLVFSMSEFIMLDSPSLTAAEALKASVRMMKGHVGQYFLLILSFLGFIILGFTSAMIGFIWVIPYILVSEAVFYQTIR